jgi:iron complex transport system substrate-binding protein
MKSLNRILCFPLITLSVIFSASCKKKPYESSKDSSNVYYSDSINFEDARGEPIALQHSAIKIVSLVPSVTEYIFALDRGHLLIGRSEACEFPEAALEIEVLGSSKSIMSERLVALKPNVILVSKKMEAHQIAKLEAQGFSIVVFDLQNWNAVLRDLEILGKILNAEGDVQTLISWLTRKRTTIEAEIGSLEESTPLSTAVLHSLDPLRAAGAGSFIDELVSISGGSNMMEDGSSQSPTLSFKALFQKQPEVILISTQAADGQGVKELAKDPMWSQIPAFKNNRVYLMDGDTLAIPGPRHIIALEQIAAALHPDIFDNPNGLTHVNTQPEPQRP